MAVVIQEQSLALSSVHADLYGRCYILSFACRNAARQREGVGWAGLGKLFSNLFLKFLDLKRFKFSKCLNFKVFKFREYFNLNNATISKCSNLKNVQI
jgi:hypothetical protein